MNVNVDIGDVKWYLSLRIKRSHPYKSIYSSLIDIDVTEVAPSWDKHNFIQSCEVTEYSRITQTYWIEMNAYSNDIICVTLEWTWTLTQCDQYGIASCFHGYDIESELM